MTPALWLQGPRSTLSTQTAPLPPASLLPSLPSFSAALRALSPNQAPPAFSSVIQVFPEEVPSSPLFADKKTKAGRGRVTYSRTQR